MTAQDLVVRPGDRVSVAGRYVRQDGVDWLDYAWIVPLSSAQILSPWSIRMLGFDARAVPQDFGDSDAILEGRARVTGVWQDDAIEVDGQTVDRRDPWQKYAPVTGPPPPGGWDTTSQSKDVPALTTLRENGAIVGDQWLRHPSGALLLRVAASDVALVRDVLEPELPRRLCVVQSRFSAEDVRRLDAGFEAHRREWMFMASSSRNLTDDGQPCAHAVLTRVTEDFANWLDTFPDGLISVRPAMTQTARLSARTLLAH